MEERFKVVFSGEIAAGRTIDEVKQNLAKLYKSPVEKLDSWFSGHTVTVKSDVDRATAEKYKNVFEKAGAICRIEAEGAVEEEPQTPVSPPPPPSEQQTGMEEEATVGSEPETTIKKQPTKQRRKVMDQKGFFGSLFDFSFTHFITPRVVKLLFILAIIGAAIAAIGMIFTGLQTMRMFGARGVIMIVLSPLAFFLWVLLARIWLEVTVVFFRIEANTRGE